MKKPIRVLSYLALAYVVIAVSLRIVDSIRFSTATPVAAADCNYQGTWTSTTVMGISGRILAELPDPLPVGESFQFEAFIYYRITSLYRLGQFVTVKMEGKVEESGKTAGDNSETPVESNQIKFSFKSYGTGLQTIEYVSTVDLDLNQITGGYRSSSPGDMGTFSLRRTR